MDIILIAFSRSECHHLIVDLFYCFAKDNDNGDGGYDTQPLKIQFLLTLDSLTFGFQDEMKIYIYARVCTG